MSCIRQPRREMNQRGAVIQGGVGMFVTVSMCTASLAKQKLSTNRGAFLQKSSVAKFKPTFQNAFEGGSTHLFGSSANRGILGFAAIGCL